MGCYRSRVIGTWDLTEMVAYGGMLNAGAKADSEELVRAPVAALVADAVVMATVEG